MLRRAGAPARAATEIATEVDQTVDGLVAQHEHDSAFDRLLYTVQLGFQESDARDARLEASLQQTTADRRRHCPDRPRDRHWHPRRALHPLRRITATWQGAHGDCPFLSPALASPFGL